MPQNRCSRIDSPHTRARLPFQLEAVGVVPGRLPCTAQEAKYETEDGHANQDSSLTCTLRVPQPAQLQMDQSIREKLARLFAVFKVKVLRTQQYRVPDFKFLVYTTLVCKRFLSLLSGNQTFACKAERRLQALNESSRRWVHDFNDLTHQSPQVIAISQLKRGCTDGLFNSCIMGKLCT
jgi:hypothetical protein